MSSRARDGFDSVFFGACCEGFFKLVRVANGLAHCACEGTGVVAAVLIGAGALAGVAGVVSGVAYEVKHAAVLISGGSDEGGSEPMLGLSDVRKGDLNGFFRVFVASFSLRRLACGVDILAFAAALKMVWSQLRRNEEQQGDVSRLFVWQRWEGTEEHTSSAHTNALSRADYEARC